MDKQPSNESINQIKDAQVEEQLNTSDSNMSVSVPIDVNYSIKQFGFKQQLYYDLLVQFEKTTLIKYMKHVKNSIERKNYSSLFQEINILKGATSYIAASHLHYTCL